MNTHGDLYMKRIVLRADILGYCMGVRRAVQAAEKTLAEYPHKKVFTLGPLIHNNQTLEKLQSKGLTILSKTDIASLCTKDAVVIIRAHGVEPKVLESLKQTGCIIIDATCPRVLSNQMRAQKFSSQQVSVILAGDQNHGEIESIAGHAPNCIIVKNEVEANALPVYPEKAILISQTTISREEYNRIAEVLEDKIPDLQVFDTICPATIERQLSLKKLAADVQGILVIGGKHSANTNRLFHIAKEKVKHAALIETADEIPSEFFTLESVGITAGASTPDEVIDAVEQRLLEESSSNFL